MDSKNTSKHVKRFIIWITYKLIDLIPDAHKVEDVKLDPYQEYLSHHSQMDQRNLGRCRG